MSALILLQASFWNVLTPRKVLGAAALVAIPALIGLGTRAIIQTREFDGFLAYNSIAASTIFGFILTLLAATYGTAVITQEVEQKTIVYLLTRPVPRWRILLTRFAGALAVMMLASGLSTLLLAAAVLGPGRMFHARILHDLLILPAGALAYGSLFLMLAALVERPMLLALAFAFGWEVWLPRMPEAFQKFSIVTYLRVLAPHPAEGFGVSGVHFLTAFNPVTVSPTEAWIVLSGITLVSLSVAVLAFSRREFVPRDDAGA